MKKQGSDSCPACRRSMFPGDGVCLRCQDRVRAVRPEILTDYANPDLNAPDAAAAALRVLSQLTLCAIQLLPVVGRPPRGDKRP